jgi:5-methylcytosine-specific restriction protein A
MTRPKLTTLKSRIPKLHAPSNGWADERRGSASERGYGWAWTKLRNVVMQRDRGLCQPCKRRGVYKEVGRRKGDGAVDHIIPKTRGGTDDLANLQSICDPCHKGKTAAEARGAEWDGLPLTEP